jgi:outer membrane protein TolC
MLRSAGGLLLAASAVHAAAQPLPPPVAEEKPWAAAVPPDCPTDAPSAPPLFNTDDIFAPGTEVLRIDLVSALRLAAASNPTIALARLRVEEAYNRLEQAQLLLLPSLEVAPAYLRHDGEIQNAAGLVFPTSKSSVYGVGGAALQVSTSEALFAPLVARRLAEAQAAASQAVDNNIQLDVALTYLDLLQSYAQLAVNTDVLARAQEVLRRTEAAVKAQLFKTGADITRARTEVALRQQERTAIRGQIRVISSRLARLLLLQPTVGILPADPALLPVVLVPEDAPVEQLVEVGVTTRPELAESRSLVAASEARLRQARLSPLLPSLQIVYQAGTFGGGQDSFLGHFNARGDGTAQAVWELRNLGLGYLAENRVHRTLVGEANLHAVEVQAQVADEVNSAVQIARARRQALDFAQEAVQQAIEMYRRLDLISFGMTGPKKELDSLEPLLAIQELARARTQYLGAVIEYNRAQFQLFTAMGKPPLEALPQAQPTPVSVPPAPTPYKPPALP